MRRCSEGVPTATHTSVINHGRSLCVHNALSCVPSRPSLLLLLRVPLLPSATAKAPSQQTPLKSIPLQQPSTAFHAVQGDGILKGSIQNQDKTQHEMIRVNADWLRIALGNVERTQKRKSILMYDVLSPFFACSSVY